MTPAQREFIRAFNALVQETYPKYAGVDAMADAPFTLEQVTMQADTEERFLGPWRAEHLPTGMRTFEIRLSQFGLLGERERDYDFDSTAEEVRDPAELPVPSRLLPRGD